MSAPALEFLIPGDLQGATGGYVYDRCMIGGLRALGWRVTVHQLDGSFPYPNAPALQHARQILSALPDHACAFIHGLALGAMPELIESHRSRLTLIALVHAPLSAAAGIAPLLAQQLGRQELRALQSAHHVIVSGRSTQQALAERGIPTARLSLVEPGTAPGRLARRGCEPPLALLCVATLSVGKGHELLLEALAPLAGLSWRLTCVR